jgi:hypothetical protein
MHRDKIIADAMGKRAMAELKRSGTRQEEEQVADSLMFSERSRWLRFFKWSG